MTAPIYRDLATVQTVFPHIGMELDAHSRDLISGAAGPLDTPFAVTLFKDQFAGRKDEKCVSLIELAILINGTRARDKKALPWLKLARFGTQRSDKGSLRTNANVTAVSGVEVDYDGGPLAPEEAAKRFAGWGIASLVYTTPSHLQPGKGNRWRALLPFSRELPPGERRRLVTWALGALGTAEHVDPASFATSTAFYFGGTDAAPRTWLIDGRFLDQCDELADRAIGERVEREPTEPAQSTGLPPDVFRDAVMTIPNDDRPYDEWLGVLASIHVELGEDGRELAHAWSEQSGKYSPEDLDRRWDSFGSYSGPKKTGASILYEARQSGWREPQLVPEDEFGPEDVLQDGLFEPASSWAGQDVPEREWLVEGLIPHGTVTMLGGDGGTGKSLLALQLAVATAGGRQWIGRTVKRPGPVLFLSAEDDRGELHRRVTDICRENGASLHGLHNLMIRSLAGEDALLATLDRKTNVLRKTALYDRLDAALAEARPTLLVLDTLADLHAGEENSRAHARQFIALLRHLAIRYECAVLLLAHPSLTGMANGSGLSGSTAWNASVRSRLFLDRVKGDDGVEADPHARVLRTVKANYAAIGGEIALSWHRGTFLTVTADLGDETPAAKADRVFLKLLDQQARRNTTVSPNPSPAYAPKVFSTDPKAEGVSRTAFQAAMGRLLDTGQIEVEQKGPPSHRRDCLRRLPTRLPTQASKPSKVPDNSMIAMI